MKWKIFTVVLRYLSGKNSIPYHPYITSTACASFANSLTRMKCLLKFACPFQQQGCSQRFWSQGGCTYHIQTRHTNHNIVTPPPSPGSPEPDAPECVIPSDSPRLDIPIQDQDDLNTLGNASSDCPSHLSPALPKKQYHPWLTGEDFFPTLVEKHCLQSSGKLCNEEGTILPEGTPSVPRPSPNPDDWDPLFWGWTPISNSGFSLPARRDVSRKYKCSFRSLAGHLTWQSTMTWAPFHHMNTCTAQLTISNTVMHHGNHSQHLMLANLIQTHLAGNFKILRSGSKTQTWSFKICLIIQTSTAISIMPLTLILTRPGIEDGMNLCRKISHGGMWWVNQCLPCLKKFLFDFYYYQ